MDEHHYTNFEYTTFAAAGIVTIALFFICWKESNISRDRAVNFLVGFLGMSVGWLIGIVLQPFTEKEHQ